MNKIARKENVTAIHDLTISILALAIQIYIFLSSDFLGKNIESLIIIIIPSIMIILWIITTRKIIKKGSDEKWIKNNSPQ